MCVCLKFSFFFPLVDVLTSFFFFFSLESLLSLLLESREVPPLMWVGRERSVAVYCWLSLQLILAGDAGESREGLDP